MQAFLLALATKVITSLLGAALSWLTGVFNIFKRDKQTDKESKESLDPLKKAKTGEEIDKGSDSALDGF